MEQKKNMVCISYGKDSLCTLYLMKEHRIKVDLIVYVDIKYNDEISGEIPPHQEGIDNYMEDRIKKDFPDAEYVRIHPKGTFESHFYRQRVKGKYVGTIYGFPTLWGRWCNKELKVSPMKRFVKQYEKEHNVKLIQYVGIATDEKNRIQAQLNIGNKLPMVDYGITEPQAMEYCKKLGILSPAYKDHYRLGCWFCPLQNKKDLVSLKNNYPHLLNKLIELEKKSSTRYKFTKTIEEFIG